MNDIAADKQSKTHSFRSGSPTWSSKSSMCGSDRTGFASSSRVSDSLASETHPAYRGQRIPRSDINSSDQEQVDVYSVTSGGGMMYRGGPGVIETGGHASNGTGRLYLTAAQVRIVTQILRRFLGRAADTGSKIL